MSLITRCPACSTLFKVVADQLKISQGWVRCGQCAEVFDAQAHMASGVGQSAPSPLHEEQRLGVPEVASAAAPTREGFAGTTVSAIVTPAVAATIDADHAANAVASHNESVEEMAAGRKSSTLYADFSDSDWFNKITPPAPQSHKDPADTGLPGSLVSLPGALPYQQEPAPSFVRQAQRAQRWQSPWVRGVLLLVGIALLAALAAQIAVHERDRIAAQEPRARLWLQELCAVAGCSVGPLKQINAVVVDASSFNKLRTEGKFELYKLALNLKNTGALSVAVPHIELSLNDAQDQPVLRRVLNPADLGSAQWVLAPAAELAGTSTIQVDSTQLAGARIAGYRVWAFYP
jgi:predicted Zn finger-like uncharacterized protein